MTWINIGSVVLVLVVLVIWFIYQWRKLGLRQIIINCILSAEQAFQQGKNDEKFNYVFTKVYNKLPLILQLIISETMVKQWIQSVFDSVKDLLDYKGE